MPTDSIDRESIEEGLLLWIPQLCSADHPVQACTSSDDDYNRDYQDECHDLRPVEEDSTSVVQVLLLFSLMVVLEP